MKVIESALRYVLILGGAGSGELRMNCLVEVFLPLSEINQSVQWYLIQIIFLQQVSSGYI
jgi:hypothetical protein